MKVLIISQYFWPENFRINDLAVSLVERAMRSQFLREFLIIPKGGSFPDTVSTKKRGKNTKASALSEYRLYPEAREIES
jgi:hypothetical protein